MRSITAGLVLAFACGAAWAQWPDVGNLLRSPSRSSSVSDDQAAAGLKEALQVGTGKAVTLTGRTDGYFRNEAIRIAMPEKLRMVEKGCEPWATVRRSTRSC